LNEVYGLAPPSVESSAAKSSYLKKKKVDPADNVLNIVTQKLQFEGKYTAFGKHIPQDLASLDDKMVKYCKKKSQ
jgi:hypothetical protein